MDKKAFLFAALGVTVGAAVGVAANWLIAIFWQNLLYLIN